MFKITGHSVKQYGLGEGYRALTQEFDGDLVSLDGGLKVILRLFLFLLSHFVGEVVERLKQTFPSSH